MEGEEKVGVALARASELRCKLNDSIQKFIISNAGGSGAAVARREEHSDNEIDDEEEEEENLISIRDALESLEHQLQALQNLHQQQRYEREASLAQIDRSRKALLSKLKQYKGEELEVIHEATAFAGEGPDCDDGLLLPPYPTHLPDLFVSDNIYTSTKFLSNGVAGDPRSANMKGLDDSTEKVGAPSGNKPLQKAIGFLFGVITKSAITILSVMSVLHMSGVKLAVRKGCYQFKINEPFQKPEIDEEDTPLSCPPGKILVIEDGKARCIVKERVEVPFESNVTTPDINYGFG